MIEVLKQMSEPTQLKKFKRKIVPAERVFTRAPYAIVTMVARIKGNVTEKMLKDAVSKVQQRHMNLRVRIVEDEDNIPWFTTEEVKEIPIKIVSRESDNYWMKVYHKACREPFEFHDRPAIRFILVQSPSISELMILCHHIICDGMSLAFLARDLMTYLGDPTQEVELLPDPVPLNKENIPKEVSLNPIIRFILKRTNKKWDKDQIYFDQEDYLSLNEAYWKNFTHKMFTVELTETQTTELVNRCKQEGLTVNSALTSAFVGAQYIIQGDKPHHSNIFIAGSLRNRLLNPPGEVMGIYVGGVIPKFNYNTKISFWDNTRKLHKTLKPLYTNKKLFAGGILNLHLNPAIRESTTFKLLGQLVSPNSSRYEKLSSFSKRDDMVTSILKRRKLTSLDSIVMGTAVTNLTRLDFPREYGNLELDRLIFNPGSALSLGHVNLVLGAVTCAEKLSLILEYAEETVDTEVMGRIKEKALELLTR
jgi:NRPS condensation-like uncharacterized protein